ncbi:hypothetical protein JCM8097_006217 [Rhodosporidiobolus ruineniae]
MSLVVSPYLSDRSLKIRAKAIPWDGYQRAGLLGQDDVHLVQRVAGQRDKAEPILDAEGETYAQLYIRLLSKLSRNDTLQFILVLLGDFINDREDRIPLFFAAPDSPYPPLLKLLDSPDDFVRLKSSVVVSALLSSDPEANSPTHDDVVRKVLSHLAGLIRSPNEPDAQDVAVQCLESVLRVAKAREVAWSTESGEGKGPKVVEGLVRLLQASPSPQMQYQLGFCFWLLTFDQTVAEQINSHYPLIPLLLSLAQQALKEKILRVVLSTYLNLVQRAPAQNLPAMLLAQVLPWIKSLEGRKFADEEIREDVEALGEELRKSQEGMSTYDTYLSELTSHVLTWSPPHKSDDFWRANAQKLADRDRRDLKLLCDILRQSQEPVTLAVAANDVAMFVKFYEGNARKALDDLGAKARVMELMTHPDPDVKYQALVATQRLMSHAWA